MKWTICEEMMDIWQVDERLVSTELSSDACPGISPYSPSCTTPECSLESVSGHVFDPDTLLTFDNNCLKEEMTFGDPFLDSGVVGWDTVPCRTGQQTGVGWGTLAQFAFHPGTY